MKHLLIILILFWATYCSKPLIYLPGEHTFIVKSTLKESNDTLRLVITDDSWKICQIKCKWIYPIIYDSCGAKTTYTEITGVVDRKYSKLLEHIFTSQIWLHPPRNLYLRMTEMVPFPKVEFPIYKGQQILWKLTPKSGWEELEGKTVTGFINITGKIYCDNPLVSDTCWVIETEGNSEIGNFKAKYYFHEKYGFVYLNYDFIKYKVEMNLISIE